MEEPGLERHEWETEWAALEPLLEDAPAEALPDLADLVERMLTERGLDVDGDGPDAPPELEVTAAYRHGREIANLVEAGEPVDPGDIASAINDLRDVYQSVVATRAST